MSHCIYVIRNLVNDKIYVGKTWNFVSRKKDHIYTARNGRGSYVHAAMRKHGVENFEFEVIEKCTADVVDERERHWIATFGTFDSDRGYNLTSGGDGDKILSEETKQKISKARRGMTFSDEHRQKLSEAQRGKKRGSMSEKTKQKIRKANLGRKHTLEARQKMSLARMGKKPWIAGRKHTVTARTKISAVHLGRTVSKATREKISATSGRSICQYTTSGDFIKEWKTVREAKEAIPHSGHCDAVANGTRKTAGGFVWRWKSCKKAEE